MPTINNASPISVNPNLTSWRGAMPSLPQQEILMETKAPTPSLWSQILGLSQAHTAGKRLASQFDSENLSPYSPLQKALYMDPYASQISQPVELNKTTANTNITPEIKLMRYQKDVSPTPAGVPAEQAGLTWNDFKEELEALGRTPTLENVLEYATGSLMNTGLTAVPLFNPQFIQDTFNKGLRIDLGGGGRTANWASPSRWRL